MLEWLTAWRPTVLLLQEVDFDTFDESFAVPLAALGYRGTMQRRRDERQPCGNASFWLESCLELEWEEHRSRTLLTAFRLGSAQLVVANAHLESAQDRCAERASQVHSALATAARRSPDASLILMGDFNTGEDSNLAAVLREHPWHGFALASAYCHPAAAATSPVVDCTFGAEGYKFSIDHCYYRHTHLRLRGLLQCLNEEQRRHSLARPHLPDGDVPSDHIPIGAVFQLGDLTRTATLGGGGERGVGRGDRAVLSPEEEAELWESAENPLSSEQRRAFEALTAAGEARARGRPTAGELEALRAAKLERMRREASFVEGLGAEGRAFLASFKRGRELLRSAAKGAL